MILDGNQIEGKEVTIDHDGNEFKYDIHDKQENNIEDTKEPNRRIKELKFRV